MKQIFTLFLFFLPFLSSAQPFVSWEQLADVNITEVVDSTNFITYNEAEFGTDLQAYSGQEVYLTGYLVPIDAMGLTYALSRNPNASCFFCGGAGPETVILLRIKPEHYKRYKTDARLSFKGLLQMNKNDLNSFIYVLKQAEEY